MSMETTAISPEWQQAGELMMRYFDARTRYLATAQRMTEHYGEIAMPTQGPLAEEAFAANQEIQTAIAFYYRYRDWIEGKP